MAFSPHRDGFLRLWCDLGPDERPLRDRRYAVGADIATGTGASNSVLSVVDLKTSEKVAEIATPDLRPDQFATLAVATCNWFRGVDGMGAFLAWERNGPGRSFGDRVNELGYRNIYYRDKETGVLPDPSNVTGWTSTRESKLALLSEYRTDLAADRFVNRSEEAVAELGEYVYLQTGEIGHARAQSKEDPSGAKSNHGDRVIADALANRAARRRPWVEGAVDLDPPPGSYAARREARRRRDRKDGSS